MRNKAGVFLLILLFLLVSCSQPNGKREGSGLYVDSNIDVASSRGMEISDFENQLDGVEFVFHDGNVTTPLGKNITDPNLFYIEYNEGKTNPNCIFYIPKVVAEVFETETGDTDAVANSYLWYMTQYQGKDIDELRKGWIEALVPLLEKKGETLPYPQESDIEDRWKSYSDKGMEEFINISSDGSGPNITGKSMNSFFFYEKEGKTILHTPCYLGKVYIAGGGKVSLYRKNYVPSLFDYDSQAFLWYAEKYYDLSSKDLLAIYKDGKLPELIEKMNAQYSYGQVQPDDVFGECKTCVVDNIDEFDDEDILYYHDVACYKSGCIVGKDGMVINDEDGIYAMIYTMQNKETYFLLLVPYDFHVKYGKVAAEAPNKWECYGNELWNYLEEKLKISETEIEYMQKTASIPAKYLKALLKSNGVSAGK